MTLPNAYLDRDIATACALRQAVGRGEGLLRTLASQKWRAPVRDSAARLGARWLRLDLTTPALLGLPLAWLVVFFLVPIAIVAAYSFDVFSLYPGPHGFTLTAWHDFLHSSVYLRLFWKSVRCP